MISTLKMEATRSSEKSVLARPTRRHIPEDGILQRSFQFVISFFFNSFIRLLVLYEVEFARDAT
jgi:hypothetical protein